MCGGDRRRHTTNHDRHEPTDGYVILVRVTTGEGAAVAPLPRSRLTVAPVYGLFPESEGRVLTRRRRAYNDNNVIFFHTKTRLEQNVQSYIRANVRRFYITTSIFLKHALVFFPF